VPVVRLNTVDNFNYTYNQEFDFKNFTEYIMDTKKNTNEVKKILKLELISKFYDKIV